MYTLIASIAHICGKPENQLANLYSTKHCI